MAWSVNLAAGEAAGVSLVAGTARLNRSGAFLAPLEDPAAGGSGSTGAANPVGDVPAGGGGSAGSGSTTPSTTTEPRSTTTPPTSERPAGGSAERAGGAAATDGSTTPVPTGLLTLPAQRLAVATVQVDIRVLGKIPRGSTATVDIRGRGANGYWSEWIPAAGSVNLSVVLPEAATEVQGRLVLTGPPDRGLPASPDPAATTAPAPTTPAGTTAPNTTTPAATPSPTPSTASTPAAAPTPTPSAPSTPAPSAASTPTPAATPTATTPAAAPTATTADPASSGDPAVSGVTIAARPVAAGAAAPAPANRRPLSYRIFATREGLVGRTTANGHKITSRDHFVALPSRRALAPRDTGDYSVKVCAANGRCAYAPVWDVGPWNTRDDYWNPRSKRQEWRDLPQGMPEAQAAREKGYNRGRDQFGRKVRNPAGIDLADGLFWDALRLRDNSWVTVDYLWTGSAKLARVTKAQNVRRAPRSDAQVVGWAAKRSSVPVECVVGSGSKRWLRLGVDAYLPASATPGPLTAPACASGSSG